MNLPNKLINSKQQKLIERKVQSQDLDSKRYFQFETTVTGG